MKKNDTCPGYVYIIHALGTDYFKIGISEESVLRQLSQLQTASPLKLRYVYHAYVEDMQRTERELHKIFSSFRKTGEWFSLGEANVKECITLIRLVQVQEPVTLTQKTNLIEADESVIDYLEFVNGELDEIFNKSSEFVWSIQLIKKYFPSQSPEQLFSSIADAARSGKTIREIVRSILKLTDGPDHPTRSYTQHGKTLLKWLIEKFDDDDKIATLPEIQKLFQKQDKE